MSDISRFLDAQNRTHTLAVQELRSGRKVSHWSWWEIPQIAGLGRSPTSRAYAIRDLAEAKEYLQNDTLRENLIELCEALLGLNTRNATLVMGSPDDMKLHSCMTLFAAADPDCETFQAVLNKYFGGQPDKMTLELIGL